MSKVRSVRFGIVAESAPSREQWITLVRKAQNLGYVMYQVAK